MQTVPTVDAAMGPMPVLLLGGDNGGDEATPASIQIPADVRRTARVCRPRP